MSTASETGDSSGASSSSAGTASKPFPLPKDCKACPEYSTMLEGFRRFSKTKDSDSSYTGSSTFGASSSSAGDDPAVSQYRGCPPDTSEIGRAAWTFLHTTAAYYPEQPTERQQGMMKSFVSALAEFYPCSICAEHLQEIVKENPPKVTSAMELSMWFCKIHNEVNESIGKPLFDCSKVFERWRDGPEDGSCE